MLRRQWYISLEFRGDIRTGYINEETTLWRWHLKLWNWLKSARTWVWNKKEETWDLNLWLLRHLVVRPQTWVHWMKWRVATNWATDSVYNLMCEDGSLLFKIENAFRLTTFSLLKELNSNILQVLHFTEAVTETWRRLIIQSSNWF